MEKTEAEKILKEKLETAEKIPGLGRSPGEGKGYPLEYSGLENPMDCIAKSGTQLSNFPLLIGFQILSRHFNLDDLLI